MPEKALYVPASWTQRTESRSFERSVPRMIGVGQIVSDLNNEVPFVRGSYRCNNVDMVKTIARSTPASYSYTWTWFHRSAEGDLDALCVNQAQYGPGMVNHVLTAWDETRAREAIVSAQAKIMEPDLTLGVTLGELEETIAGLRNPLSALRKALPKLIGPKYVPGRSLGKVSFNEAKRSAKGVLDGSTGTWLEYRYGIAPLISEVQSIIEYINAQIRAFDANLKTKTSKRSVKRVLRDERDIQANDGDAIIVSSLKVTEEDFYSASVGYRLKRPLTLDESLGLSLLDIPSIIWETTTLSFVLDWFIRVGTWLESLKPVMSSAIDLQGVSVSRRATLTIEAKTKQVLISGWYNYPFTGGSYLAVSDYLTRSCRTPDFISWVPPINTAALSLEKQIDSLSLLYQSLGRRR